MKMKLIQLSDFLYNMPDSDIENLAIYNGEDQIVDGETILGILLEHTFRSMLIPASYDSIAGYSLFFTEYRYKYWLRYRLPDIIRSLQAVLSYYLNQSIYFVPLHPLVTIRIRISPTTSIPIKIR